MSERTRGPDLTPEEVREGLTMALYLSLSLLAVMLALPEPSEGHEALHPAVRIALTSGGLLAAHLVAFRISSRFTEHGELSPQSLRLLGSQLVGGLLVTLGAVVPVAVIDGPNGLRVAEVVLLVFVALVAYATARVSGGTSRARAAVYVAGTVAVVVVVLAIKALAGH